MDEKTYSIELTKAEINIVLFALGGLSATYYDGTHKHGEEDNRMFRKTLRVANKFGLGDMPDPKDETGNCKTGGA